MRFDLANHLFTRQCAQVALAIVEVVETSQSLSLDNSMDRHELLARIFVSLGLIRVDEALGEFYVDKSTIT